MLTQRILTVLAISLVASAKSGCRSKGHLKLPADDAIKKVVAEVLPTWGAERVAGVEVPPKYRAQLLDLFRGAERYDYPSQLDREPIVKIRIESRFGETVELVVPVIGKTQLHCSVGGVRYIRAGAYTPSIEGEFGYAAESLLLANGIAAIAKEVATGHPEAEAAETFVWFERSMGKLRPADDGAAPAPESAPQ